MTTPAIYNTEVFQKMSFHSQHPFEHETGTFVMESFVEDHVFYDESGREEAVINTIAYTRPSDEPRPVMFLWNGGPGSATSTLNLECFGPYQMKKDGDGMTASNELVEDPNCLLDICDLVFVDPVGVGFSRLLNSEKQETYYSLDGDARSNAYAVLDWIRTHRRWDSPIYLLGESYGTVRVSRMLEEFGRNPMVGNKMMLGLKIAGIILVGVALSVDEKGSIYDPKLDLLTSALPTMAAVNWYHNHKEFETPIREEDFVENAWQFVAKELCPALFQGDECPDSDIQRLAEKLSEITGMDASYFVKTRLTLRDVEDFMTQVAAAQGNRVDIYDGRVTQPLSKAYNPVGDSNIPLLLMNGKLAEKLSLDPARLYFTGNINVNDAWSYKSADGIGNMDCLKHAMDRMPEMKVFVASGRYDLCTLLGNTRYLFSHAGLPRQNLTLREYEGGHGVYSSTEGKRKFLADIRAMLCTGCGQQ
ncbi:MAG: S10 family serine carboxypeptidase-like protein [Acutalibacter sp.]|jgi:carboxypeptidase C (cathepsin A)